MLDLDLGWLAYAKNDFEVKNPLFVTENDLKGFIFWAFKQTLNLAVCSFGSRSISMSDIYIRFFSLQTSSRFS